MDKTTTIALFTAYRLLFTAYCLLLTAYCLLLTAYYFPISAHPMRRRSAIHHSNNFLVRGVSRERV